ncbi:MAG: T9SS type A sorting domain-containing protein [bacterium]
MDFKVRSILLTLGINVFALTSKAQPIAVQQSLPIVEKTATYTISGYKSEQFDAKDNAPTKYNQILNVGRLLPSQITLQNGGQWNATPTGRIWRLKIKADDAKGISLLGKVKYMPKGAKLNFYNADGSEWVSKYDAKDFATHNILSTDAVAGEEAILEYYEPKGTKQTADIIIERIGYMYREEIRANSFQRKSFGTSGNCQVNVNCPEGDDWDDQKKAVVRMRVVRDFVIGWCTGTLVRTTDKAYKPYLLSAMHCALTPAEDTVIHDTMFNYWRFTFNYEAPTCANPISEGNLADQTIVGAKVLAHSDDLGGEFGSDFLLLNLSSIVPSDYKAYYAGWNLDTVRQYDSGVCIHHPDGDIKKISTYKWPLSFDEPFSTSPPNTHWEVIWSSTGNGHGTTEPGSSGAPLFDDGGLIVGTLTGGNSKCSNTSGTDLFGRIDWHFTRNGNDSLTQLKYWLDPENTGVTSFQGSYDELRSVVTPKVIPLKLYPNPANDYIAIENDVLVSSKTKVQVIDAIGKQYAITISDVNRINVSGLPVGVYFVTITGGRNYFSGRFIKQ